MSANQAWLSSLRDDATSPGKSPAIGGERKQRTKSPSRRGSTDGAGSVRFDDLDTNGDGVISRAEWEEYEISKGIKSAGQSLEYILYAIIFIIWTHVIILRRCEITNHDDLF